MAALREKSKIDIPDDTANDDNSAMSTVEMDANPKYSDNSSYENVRLQCRNLFDIAIQKTMLLITWQ
eukprot:6397063-Ditylum_brightwellii.AAC.1